MTEATMHRAGWVRPLYLYAVSVISLVVFIIGAVSIVNLLIRNYVFGLKSDWYQSPESSCEYILTQEDLPRSALHRYPKMMAPTPVAVEAGTTGESTVTAEERQAGYEQCMKRVTEEMEIQAKHDFARTMSNGIAMIIVSVPLFWFHWSMIRREQRKTND